jgi:phage I-like protein
VFEQIALSVELSLTEGKAPPTEFRLFKAGKNKTLKGEFIYSSRSQKDCAEFAAELDRPLAIDYEHASLNAAQAIDPKKAGEAAGWFSVEARKDGLWATKVEWVDDAAALLTARKFRFFSPVVTFDKATREVTGVINAALTCNPATMGQTPLVASVTTQEPRPMKLIASLVSLSADATEEAIASAVTKLTDERALLLALTGKGSVAEASGTIAAWKSGSEQAAALSARVAELEGVQKSAEVLSLLEKASAEGKVAPAQKDLLIKMGNRDVEELKAFLSAAPKLMPTASKEPAAGSTVVVLSAEDTQVAAMLGVKPEDVAKRKTAMASSVG